MKKRSGRVLKTVLVMALAFVCLAEDSRLRLVTTEYTLTFDTLPEPFDGFRIIQLSDLHGMVFGAGNTRLLRAVAAAEPDLIALTGDLADKNTDLADVDTLLEGLAELAPVYYVSGNHEWSAGLLEPLGLLFRHHGVCRLANAYLPLERDGSRIILAGVDDPNGRRDMEKPDGLAARLREEYPTEFALLLGHRNDWTEKYPALPVELVLCGHAHGGIIRIPGLGGLLGAGYTFFPDCTAGIYPMESGYMLVSRGLGSSTTGIPRLCNNPEIVAVTLRTG